MSIAYTNHKQVDGEHGLEKLFPVHALIWINATNAEDEPFQWVHKISQIFSPLKTFDDIFPQWIRKNDAVPMKMTITPIISPVIHQNFSGLINT